MITEIKSLLERYKLIQKGSEYIAIGQVINDLHALQMECRLKRIPKNER